MPLSNLHLQLLRDNTSKTRFQGDTRDFSTQSSKSTKSGFRQHQSPVTLVSSQRLHSTEEENHDHIVRIRLVFLRIGEIDTLNEKYQADIYFEARWIEKEFNINKLMLPLDERLKFLNENVLVKQKTIDLSEYWTPELFIENAIGQVSELDKWFTLKKNISKTWDDSASQFISVEICQHQRISGTFWEKLELNYFPVDVQDLTISITTRHLRENCKLVQDEYYPSSINREAFFDQQEWSLYQHVVTEMREIQGEYSFETENVEEQRKQYSVLAITCRAARQAGYYYWNGFFLIFLITVSSFCIFSILPSLPQNRLQITSTLLLTSVTFRWIVNRSLPQVSYLTTLDIYSIVSIIILVMQCIWHAIIATIAFHSNGFDVKLGPTSTLSQIDRYVFIFLISIYLIVHLALIVWVVLVPYKRRREMTYLDQQYIEKRKNAFDAEKADNVFKRNLKPYYQSKQIDDISTTIKYSRMRKNSNTLSEPSSFVNFQPKTDLSIIENEI